MLRISTWLGLFLFAVSFPLSAHCATLNVPAEYATIQAGVDAAAVGDTVLLASGIYYGDGNRDIDFLGKDITVRSHDNNPATCTIFCQGTLYDPHRGFIFQSGESPLALLEGVTITEGYIPEYQAMSPNGGAIICQDGSSPTIKNCRLTQCEVMGNGGGFASYYSSPTLIDCKIDNNHSMYGGGGLCFTGDNSMVMSGCLVTDNVCDSGFDGMILACPTSLIFECTFANHNDTAIYSERSFTLSHCTIVNNGIGVTSYLNITMENTLVAFNETAFSNTGDNQFTINCNNVFGNDNGDWVAPLGNFENINGNICMEPALCDPDNWDFHVSPDSPCIDDLCGQIGAFGIGQCAGVSAVANGPEVLFGLRGNHPNPFNPSTAISYFLDVDSALKLQIFDVSGKLVRTLADEANAAAGMHDAHWNGCDDSGQKVAAGVFLYVLTTPYGRDTGRMALIK